MSMVCYGQTVDSLTYCIRFGHNSSVIDTSRAENVSALSRFANDLDSLRSVQNVDILGITAKGCSSWEGSYIGNQYLCRLRARAVAGYIKSTFGADAMPTESYQFESDIIDFVSKSGSNYSKEVISILKGSDTYDGKVQYLKALDSGRCWEWLRYSVFPAQRRVDIIIRYSVRENVTISPVVSELPMKTEEPVQVEEPIKTEEPIALMAVAEPADTIAAAPADSVESKSSFFLALKNNIIYDAALVANLGLEISLGKHLALDLPFTFSPYDICSEYRMRTLSVQPELRCYFKRGGKGHFLGIHGNVAYYNFVTPLNPRTRFQDRDGEHPLYGGGISYGYSVPFGKDSRWGIEFTIGGGYAYLDYDCFYNVDNGAWFTKDCRHYFGVDKAGITIYCRFVDRNRKKK